MIPNLEDEIARAQRGALEIAHEALCCVFERMPFGQEFFLSTGQHCTIKPLGNKVYTGAEREEDSGPNFTFDVRMPDCSPDHLEFHVSLTGWGGLTFGALAAEAAAEAAEGAIPTAVEEA